MTFTEQLRDHVQKFNNKEKDETLKKALMYRCENRAKQGYSFLEWSLVFMFKDSADMFYKQLYRVADLLKKIDCELHININPVKRTSSVGAWEVSIKISW